MLKRFFNDTRRYFPYSIYAAKAELKSEISNSYLQWIWLVLEPLCFILIYTFIVQVVFRSTERYLQIFIFIGLTIWNFFSKTLTASVDLVRSYKGTLIKTYLPKYVLLYTRIWKNGFKMLISFIIMAIMLIMYGVPINLYMVYILPILLLCLLLTFAFSSIMLHFGTFVDDLGNITTIALRFLFYLSGIFYSIPSRVPEPYGDLLLHYNPVAFLINQMREVMLYNNHLDFAWFAIWTVAGTLIAVLGISLIYRYENAYAKVI